MVLIACIWSILSITEETLSSILRYKEYDTREIRGKLGSGTVVYIIFPAL